ncbi:MAG: type II toxin-antitoxin system HipA family toxin [Gemmatimonadales bacterium]
MPTARGAVIHIDLQGTTHRIGTLRAVASRQGERAGFEYDPAWLASPHRFALEPALRLTAGTNYPPNDRALFGAFSDSAPDRWGRTLMQRGERQAAQREGALHELDYLLGVSDISRQGALRFTALSGGPFLAAGDAGVPPLLRLPRLLVAADQVDGGEGGDEDLRLLLAPGSSLGGARPKASVRDDDGALAIAKFSRRSDEWPVVEWEAVALRLAREAGVDAAPGRLLRVGDRQVLLTRRFDRRGETRVPYLSAMSLLGARDNAAEPHSYPEIAEGLRRHGAAPRHDLAELWRRMVFTVLIANTDDHLRNHGFLWGGAEGWRLSPAFDLNPTPADVRPRVLSTALTVDGDTTASLDRAFEVMAWFDLKLAGGKAIATEVGGAVARWRDAATELGLNRAQCDRMASAFEG